MPLRAEFQCIAFEGKCLLEVRKRSDLLETGMEGTREVAERDSSIWMSLRMKL